MLEKGVIKKIVPWKQARAFFGKRLRERLCRAQLKKLCLEAYPSISASRIERISQELSGNLVSNGARSWTSILFSIHACAHLPILMGETGSASIHRHFCRSASLHLAWNWTYRLAKPTGSSGYLGKAACRIRLRAAQISCCIGQVGCPGDYSQVVDRLSANRTVLSEPSSIIIIIIVIFFYI